MERYGADIVMQEETGACGFLADDGRCSIHMLRPGICRLFPLARDYSDDYPEPDAILTAVRHGGKVAEYPVIMHERMMGESSIGFRKSVYYMVKVSLSIMMHRVVQRGF